MERVRQVDAVAAVGAILREAAVEAKVMLEVAVETVRLGVTMSAVVRPWFGRQQPLLVLS